VWVSHISLNNFRNYDTAEISLKRGANLFLGPNGQGKTNIVEALNYFSSLLSHRTAQDHPLIRAEQSSAVVRMRVHTDAREILLEVQLNREGTNRAQLNRAAVKPRELTHYFDSVIFAPEDLHIVRGEPSHRRKFIDTVLVQRNPQLAGLFSDYERVVKQRSALLKSSRFVKINPEEAKAQNHATLDVWNERLVSLGSRIIEERQTLIERISGPLQQAYRDIVDANHEPTIHMLSSFHTDGSTEPSPDAPQDFSSTEDEFRAALVRVAQREHERGVTLVGPHRDDLVFTLNQLPVKSFASHGETWSYVLSLRLATAKLMRDESNAGDPVIILDDVFAELDDRRRQRLLDSILDFEQVIVTAAVDADVPKHLPWNIVHVNAGTVVADAQHDEVIDGRGIHD